MNWLRKVMYGRYGVDQLTIAIMIFGLVLSILEPITKLRVLTFLSFAIFLLCYFRMFSKNYSKRREENDKFLKLYQPIKFGFQQRINKLKDQKTHKYYKCPKCAKTVRVPRGKGKICITCPICREEFIRKS